MSHPSSPPQFLSLTATALAKSLLLAGVLLVTGIAFAQSADTLPYVVQPGESLRSIAQQQFKFGGSWQALRDLNGIPITRENSIRPGQSLLFKREWVELPAPKPLAEAKASISSAGAGFALQTSEGVARAGAGAALAEGSRLRTGTTAGASFTLEDGSKAQLSPYTVVDVVQLRKDAVSGQLKSIFRLVQGTMQIAVSKLTGAKPDRVVITTATATIGVRGTVFRVNASDTDTTSEVIEGTVALAAAGAEVPVPGGFGSKVQGNAPPLQPVALLPASKDFSRLPYYEARSRAASVPARFEWEAVGGAVRYTVQVATDAQFESLVGQMSSASARADFEALPRGYLFVRVRAYDVNDLGGYDLVRSIRM